MSFTAPAPADIGIMSIGVPPGSDVDLDLRLESVIEGVLVTGTARVRLEGECSRCLDPVSDELEIDVQELYLYEETDHRGRVVEHREDDEQRTGRCRQGKQGKEPGCHYTGQGHPCHTNRTVGPGLAAMY